MSRLDALSTWTATVSTRLPHLSRPQAVVLAAWSFACVLTQSCGRTTAATFLASLWGQATPTVEQRLREWCYDAPDKKGRRRVALDITPCFAPLLRWLISLWPASDAAVVLVLDATLLGDRCAVLAMSLVYRGCAIPVAWKVVAANRNGAWRPHWIALLDAVAAEIPPSWTVLVQADRGLYARWLYQRIVAAGWHPYLRLHRHGLFRVAGQARWHDLRVLVPQPGYRWQGRVNCFKGSRGRLDCTVVARWEVGQAEPWLIATDLAPDVADWAWYKLRAWIEAGFKDTKRGGWHWEQTKMRDPARVERQWLVIALATLWVVTVGGAADAQASTPDLADWPAGAAGPPRRSRARLVSCFRRGVLVLLAGLVRGQVPEVEVFWPEPWPDGSHYPRLQETVLDDDDPQATAA